MADAFSLENFAPALTTKFKLAKHPDVVFEVDGDPDTGEVVQLLKFEQRQEAIGDEIQRVTTEQEPGWEVRFGELQMEGAESADEAKAYLLSLIQKHQPEVTKLRCGSEELSIVFALILHGSSVASVVASRISNTAGGADDVEPGEPQADDPRAPREGDDEVSEATVTPLPSATLSSERSSSLDEPEAGLPATGTA
jgi:hypothetical protein